MFKIEWGGWSSKSSFKGVFRAEEEAGDIASFISPPSIETLGANSASFDKSLMLAYLELDIEAYA